MSDKTRGLYNKYNVTRVDGKEIKYGCVVLEFSDKKAHGAIRKFADEMLKLGYIKLSHDLFCAIPLDEDLCPR